MVIKIFSTNEMFNQKETRWRMTGESKIRVKRRAKVSNPGTASLNSLKLQSKAATFVQISLL